MVSLFNRFEWDEVTLTFRRSPVRLKSYLRRLPSVLGAAFGLSVGLIALTYGAWERYFLAVAERESLYLQAEEARLRKDIAHWEQQIEWLHARAEKLYRPILGVPAMPAAQWEGSMGGSPFEVTERSLYRARTLVEEYHLLRRLLEEQASSLTRLPCTAPLSGPIVSGFGFRRDPFHGAWQMHTGIDISASYGAPVRATAAGRVRFAGWDGGGYGLQVEIDHANHLVTKYAHLSRLAVQVGDSVRRGQVVGYVGSTGYSIAPHLHYEVIERGVKVDPRKYLLLP